VDKGCLSDPPSDVVKIHRVNPRTGKVRSARGAGGCENDHRWLNDLLDMPAIGIARAERATDNFCEMSNDRKMVNRLGTKEQPACRTDKLLFLNSLAKSCGFDEAQLPFEVSYPPSPPARACMGLNFDLPEEFRLPERQLEDAEGASQNREASVRDMARFQFSAREEEEAEDEDAAVRDMSQFLEGIEFDDGDLPAEGDQFTPRDETETEAEVDSRQHEEDGMPLEDLEPAVFATFEQEVAAALPKIVDRESTMQAWEQLTQQRPIVPFKNPRLPLTDLDKAEHALFDELSGNHTRRSAHLGGMRGCKQFEAEWSRHVVNRFREKLTRLDDGTVSDVQLVHRKTCLHLRQRCDKMESSNQTASLAGTSDGAINRLRFQLQDSRREMPPHQEAHQREPFMCNCNNNQSPAPFGNPATLNPNVAANAFTCSQRHNNGSVPFHCLMRSATALSTASGFKRGTCCFKCGWRKREHSGSHKFGRERTGNAGRDERSKRFMRLEFHTVGLTGPRCVKTAHKDSDSHKWCPAQQMV